MVDPDIASTHTSKYGAIEHKTFTSWIFRLLNYFCGTKSNEKIYFSTASCYIRVVKQNVTDIIFKYVPCIS
jgi:hypothetical protein